MAHMMLMLPIMVPTMMIIMVGDAGTDMALMIRMGIKIIFIITGLPVIAIATSLCGLGVVWTLR